MFITLEGVEGSGKTTLARALAERLEAAGRRVILTREPGGSKLGERLRSLLLDAQSPIAPSTELFLFLADRAQHVHEVIRPALASGTVVLCDRFVDSTLVYQGCGRGFDESALRRMCELATGGLRPDLTFLLDLDVRIGLTRAARRHQEADTTQSEGRFEAESLAFHEIVRSGFVRLAQAEPRRFVILDGTLKPAAMAEAAWTALGRQGLVHESV